MDLTSLIQPADTKILLVVMDGLGGYADAEHGTELEEAATPHLDQLASEGTAGMFEPVGPGITPGSGPGHLGLFGYDPEQFELGRGALAPPGSTSSCAPATSPPAATSPRSDPAARSPTVAPAASPIPRRRQWSTSCRRGCRCPASRCSSATSASTGVLVVLRGPGLDPRLSDTDPQHTGVAPLTAEPLDPEAKRTADLIAEVDTQVRRVLADEPKANVVLYRGFDTHRELPGFAERFGLRAAAVAIYPMYRGIARLLGMDVLGRPADLTGQLEILRESWDQYDYFFLHHKYTDSAGEDGDRARKIAAIEQLDAVVPDLRALSPDVIAVSGDHATPSQMAAHSWHPVPTLLWSDRCGRDDVEQYGERWCRQGALGLRPTKDLMAFMLANAARLAKYGA